jgi:hypothetical protein
MGMDIIKQRFFQKVDIPIGTGCWMWTAGTSPKGYGRFSVGAQRVFAHRWAYIYAKGPVPEGLELDHLCRVRSCVNPDHLEAVTHQENIRRSEAGDRSKHQSIKTHCPSGHPYSGSNLYILKSRFGRSCRECHRVYERKRKAKVRINKR